MHILRDYESVSDLSDPLTRGLIERRVRGLAEEVDCDPWDLVFFVVVESGDPLSLVEEAVQRPVFRSGSDGLRFNEPGFIPFWEVLEEHPHCYEMVIVLGDDGSGVLVFIQKAVGVDPEILALCKQYAVPAQEVTDL